MAKKGFKRKLTAILSADAVEYSRLMGEDEEATVHTLKAYRDILYTLIQQHNGQVLDSPGDNLLAEFVSVVDAVQCAVAVQKEIKARNDELPENRRMQFRIGINLGDVIQEEDQIFGDGVNIAARLEALAEPGGICISKTAFDHIESKLPYGYDFIGDKTVKNIARPVGAYRVLLDPRVTISGKPIDKKPATIRRMPVLVGTAVILLIAVAVGIWQYYMRRPSVEPASVEKMAYPLPQKPSVAVLPFVNMSGDPRQEFFSDGLTDQIIASLSRVHELFVIARNSTFTYKGKSIKVQQVAEDLGVRYVLEGSVRRSEDRLRVTVQLIDALKGYHLWAEQYDREIKDIFAVQDDITMQILRAMQVRLTTGPIGIKAKGTQNLQAHLKLLEAISVFFQFSKDGNVRSRQLCEETILIDPGYATAYGLLSFIHMLDIAYGLSKSWRGSIEKATWYAKKAQGLDEMNYIGYIAMVGVYVYERDYENAIREAQKAIELAPGAAGPNHSLARALCFSGRSHEAIDYFKKAIRIDPFPSAPIFLELGYAYYLTGNYEEAVKVCKKACALMPDNEDCHRMLAASYGMLGKDVEARAEAAELLRIVPEWSIEGYNQRQGFIWKNQEDVEHFAEGSRRAGLLERPPLSLTDKPSIAVLPFANMSGDPGQEYFSDGISEEIITALSKIEQLVVIARHSSFSYKGKPLKIQQVAEELDVHYVLEGSVRKSGDKVRVTAQLVDAVTGNHLWAERYDRKLEDIFVVQDDITKQIITAMQVKLTAGEQACMFAKGTKNLNAYLKLLQANQAHIRLTKNDNLRAQGLYKEAIALDPLYAGPYVGLGFTYLLEILHGSNRSREELIERAFQMAQKAIELDRSRASAYALMSAVYERKGDYEKAIFEQERAVALAPNGADAHAGLCRRLYTAGRYIDAKAMMEKALRLNPFPPSWYYLRLGFVCILLEHYEEAIEACKRGVNQGTGIFGHLLLSAALSLSGQQEAAHAQAREVMRINPDFSLKLYKKRFSVAFKKQSDLERYYDGLRKAGLK